MWPPLYTQPPPPTLNEGDDQGLPGEVLTLLLQENYFHEVGGGGGGGSVALSYLGGSIVEGVTVEPGHRTSKDIWTAGI